MADLRNWVAGARPRTLPAAIVPVVVGSGVAFGYGKFSLWRAALAPSLSPASAAASRARRGTAVTWQYPEAPGSGVS